MIFIDSQEPLEIVNKLQEKHIQIVVQTLPVGDYYICGENGDIVITRKTYLDLARSIGDASVWSEISRMCESAVEKKLFILEGKREDVFEYKDYSYPSVFGAEASIALDWSFPILTTRSMAETAYLLSYINERLGRDKVIKHWKVRHLPRIDESERPRYLVEGLPHVGGKKSVALLEKFGTALNVFLAEPHELQQVDGIGKTIAKEIYESLRRPYTPKKRGRVVDEDAEEGEDDSD